MEHLPLRDIHLPAPVGWWPPAIGWWLLLGVLLLLIAIGVWGYRRWRRVTPVKLALAALDELRADGGRSEVDKLRQLAILMKRVALSRGPREDIAALSGEDWLRWLDQKTGDTRFSDGPGRLLADAPYRPVPPVDQLEALFALCREWLLGLDRRRSRKSGKRVAG